MGAGPKPRPSPVLLIRLLTLGHRPPDWVSRGFEEYAKRMPAACSLQLIELPAVTRKGQSTQQSMAAEAQRLREQLGKGNRLIALDEHGKPWSSLQLSQQLDGWLHSGQDIDLLIGGADGLDRQLLAQADQRWSLSALTLPHMLVRVVVAEALYRAHTILNNHPYHRA